MRFAFPTPSSFSIAAILALMMLSVANSQQPTREAKVLADKKKFESIGLWYYNDLNTAFDEAKKTNKPLLVILRCIPCEECVKLDDDLVEADPTLQKLLKSFVRCRIVGTNGLDLSLFDYDTDQSFAVFMFNADRTLYGRYGTRSSQKEWQDDVSVEGLGKAMQAALDIHGNYPANKSSLAGKQARKPSFASPEMIPSLAAKYSSKLDYEGNVVKSCIHCHQIGDALRDYHRSQSETGKIPEAILFPFPHPKSVGLILDPKECATVKNVKEDSIAQKAGFKPGDRIVHLQGQPIFSVADVQWVLENIAADGGTVNALVDRASSKESLKMQLPAGWRSLGDISWRVSSWQLRQKGLGGMLLKPVAMEDRTKAGLDDRKLALVVEHVGQYAPHDRAKKAGVQKGDILVEFDGLSQSMTESDVLAHAINRVQAGKSIPMKFLRDKEYRTVEIATAK